MPILLNDSYTHSLLRLHEEASMQTSDYRRGLAVPYLRAWREARILTQDELAVKSGVSAATISAAERGRAIQIPKIGRLAKALGIDRVTLVTVSPKAERREQTQ
jgi:DNA-binding XRE family transcriptional regulator